MPNISVNKVAEILKKNELSPALLRRVIEEMNLAVQPDEDKPEAVQKQVAIIVSDPNGVMPKTDLVGWVVKIPETESVATTLDRITQAAHRHNSTKRGRLHPVSTVGEALENVKAGEFKENDVWVLTKTPVLILKSDNAIPKAKE
jgi:hypothetical protein